MASLMDIISIVQCIASHSPSRYSQRKQWRPLMKLDINNPREPSANDIDEKKNVCFDSTVVSVIVVEHQITLETEGSLGDGLVLLKQGTVNTLLIDIVEVDSEDEREKTATR
ncbi:hypothetical protein MKX03_031131 [Papaver bracteatum]|nr:hypothetical protein MKX03_031131 [Papaver bracteatum]